MLSSSYSGDNFDDESDFPNSTFFLLLLDTFTLDAPLFAPEDGVVSSEAVHAGVESTVAIRLKDDEERV